jgi:hypothetical protein
MRDESSITKSTVHGSAEFIEAAQSPVVADTPSEVYRIALCLMHPHVAIEKHSFSERCSSFLSCSRAQCIGEVTAKS